MKHIREGSSFCPKVSACLVVDFLVIFHAILSLIFLSCRSISSIVALSSSLPSATYTLYR